MKPLMQKALLSSALILTLAGCASSGVKNPSGVPVTQMNADERGFVAGTGIESQDLAAGGGKKGRSIFYAPGNSRAATTPRIVVMPVENATRFPVNKDIFVDRIRILLNSRANGKVRFLARDTMTALEAERAAKRAGQVTAASDPNVQEFKGADYFLRGK